MSVPVTLAVPGDLSAPTGGYHYDRSLLAAMREAGRIARHLALPSGFPFPDAGEMRAALTALAAVPADTALIVDGLAFGALETAGLKEVHAPILALVHHPLAHESGLPAPEARRLQALERANLARAAHVMVPSPHIRDVLISDYDIAPERVTVIRPGRSAYAAPISRLPQDGPPLILSVGLLHPRKGHDVLIDALGQIADLAWQAVIVGSPWEEGHEARLQAQIAAAGIEGRVRLAGRVEDDTLARLYREAHVFALATRYEGYGIVFDEALIHGLPIVSTRAGAVPGTVPEAAGLLVPPGNSDAFAEALREVLEDKPRHAAMAGAAAQAGAALPTWEDAAALALRIADGLHGRPS